MLTAPGAGPAELALLLGGVHRTFVICEALGTEQEEVSVLTSDKVADHIWRDPNVVIAIGGPAAAGNSGWIAGQEPGYPGPLRGWALPAEDYGRPPGDPGPSAQLRALQLARVGPRTGDLVWDIGAGGGAFAVEAARLGAAVIAVDRDADSCALATANARRYGVQIQVVHGIAPEALEDLPEPDVVRVGRRRCRGGRRLRGPQARADRRRRHHPRRGRSGQPGAGGRRLRGDPIAGAVRRTRRRLGRAGAGHGVPADREPGGRPGRPAGLNTDPLVSYACSPPGGRAGRYPEHDRVIAR